MREEMTWADAGLIVASRMGVNTRRDAGPAIPGHMGGSRTKAGQRLRGMSLNRDSLGAYLNRDKQRFRIDKGC